MSRGRRSRTRPIEAGVPGAAEPGGAAPREPGVPGAAESGGAGSSGPGAAGGPPDGGVGMASPVTGSVARSPGGKRAGLDGGVSIDIGRLRRPQLGRGRGPTAGSVTRPDGTILTDSGSQGRSWY